MRCPIGLYLHIPFCKTKCPYCDFNTYAGIETIMDPYLAALQSEIAHWGGILGRPVVDTVFFGGGTPSYLPVHHIDALTRCIRRAFDVDVDAEFTIEANPDDAVLEKLCEYLLLGINRLSIGVQSLNDRVLGLLGRRHSAAEAVKAFRVARRAGFENISIDLMYGLPEQSLADWEDTVLTALDLGPEHISMYGLVLESGTPMQEWVRLGNMSSPDPDLAADMYLLAGDAMDVRGYRHYEISNWAQKGKQSRHNLKYWCNDPYLGVGPGAHSYLEGCRFSNIDSPREYIKRLECWPGLCKVDVRYIGCREGSAPTSSRDVTIERARCRDIFSKVPVVEGVNPIERQMEMAETMMLGLRLDTGIEVGGFLHRFGESPAEAYGHIFEQLESLGLLQSNDMRITLTDRGKLLGNEVFSRFFETSDAVE